MAIISAVYYIYSVLMEGELKVLLLLNWVFWGLVGFCFCFLGLKNDLKAAMFGHYYYSSCNSSWFSKGLSVSFSIGSSSYIICFGLLSLSWVCPFFAI
jgi:hypothetical protein